MYFTDLPLNEDLLDALYDMHFDECTPVQEHTIPQILSKNDVIGIAQTGTGKTAAYLLPLLTLLADEEHPADAVNALIMAPTRELAKQIDQALQGFSYYLNVNVAKAPTQKQLMLLDTTSLKAYAQDVKKRIPTTFLLVHTKTQVLTLSVTFVANTSFPHLPSSLKCIRQQRRKHTTSQAL